MATTAKKQQPVAWDAPENEAQNNFVSWGEPGDFLYGTLIGTRKVKSTLPGKENELQTIYDVKVKECSYHALDDKKRVIEEPVTPNEGDIVSVGGRSTIDSRMSRVKVGQIFGLKFIEEAASKTKGFNPTKVIRVYTPKLPSGEFEMDEEFLASKADELDQFDSGK
jgi:hypothetical protein